MTLKDNIDFKMLKRYGFIKAWTGLYVYVNKENYIEIEINPITRRIDGDEKHLIIQKMRKDNLLESEVR